MEHETTQTGTRRGRRLVVVVSAAVAAATVTAVPAHSAVGGATSVNGLIAFEREMPAGNHTQTDIYTVGPEGTGVVRLTATPNLNEFSPAWEPDGGGIAFWRSAAPAGTGSLWVMAADGTGQRRLTVGVDARDPAWNPAGTRLVYDKDASDLFTLRASDGKDRQQLTSGPALDFEPAWSPDGSTIAFTRGSSTGDPGNICLLDVSTGAVTRITGGPGYDHQVAWGPYGHMLVFERDWGDRSAIFTVGADGTGLKRLTYGQYFDVGPTFSPDAQLIAFGSDRDSVLDNLWVMSKDGSDLHEFLALPYSSGFPSWSAE